MLPEITPLELQKWKESRIPFFLLDVREPWEYTEYNLGGHLLPLAQLPAQTSQLPSGLPIVVVCQSGARSAQATTLLRTHLGFQEVFNLKGGVQACIQQNLILT
jgi:adenylyltransferase/sulfurtransferase